MRAPEDVKAATTSIMANVSSWKRVYVPALPARFACVTRLKLCSLVLIAVNNLFVGSS